MIWEKNKSNCCWLSFSDFEALSFLTISPNQLRLGWPGEDDFFGTFGLDIPPPEQIFKKSSAAHQCLKHRKGVSTTGKSCDAFEKRMLIIYNLLHKPKQLKMSFTSSYHPSINASILSKAGAWSRDTAKWKKSKSGCWNSESKHLRCDLQGMSIGIGAKVHVFEEALARSALAGGRCVNKILNNANYNS